MAEEGVEGFRERRCPSEVSISFMALVFFDLLLIRCTHAIITSNYVHSVTNSSPKKCLVELKPSNMWWVTNVNVPLVDWAITVSASFVPMASFLNGRTSTLTHPALTRIKGRGIPDPPLHENCFIEADVIIVCTQCP